MTFSALATETWPLGYHIDSFGNRYTKHDSRGSNTPEYFIVHHAATTSDSALKSAYTITSRTLSSTYAMKKDATIVRVLSESRKPNTSSALIDYKALTIEIVNQTGAPNWELSMKQLENLARLIADAAIRYNWGVITRKRVISHQEVLTKHGQGYATACPGPWMQSRMDLLVRTAEEYRKAGGGKPATQEGELTMSEAKKIMDYIDARTRSAGGSPFQIVQSGKNHWLQTPVGRVGVWGADLPHLRSTIVALNWQRRDGAAPKGKSDVAYATGGPGPYAYGIFDLYVRAAAEGKPVQDPKKRK